MQTTYAQLGRDTVKIISEVTGRVEYRLYHFDNVTEKYCSIKVETNHLTEQELAEVSNRLNELHPDRFLKVYNSHVRRSKYGWPGGQEKVNVRFSKKK